VPLPNAADSAAGAICELDKALPLVQCLRRIRLARDYERDPAVSEAMIRWAAIATITRRIARGGPATRQQRRTFPTPA
jgi:hypothetical protein